MKYLTKLNVALLVLASVSFAGCDDEGEKPVVQLEATTVADLNSESTKNFTLFSFANNATVLNTDSATTKWDIGFRGTTIILNGGTSGSGQASGQVVDGIFDELTEAPANGYVSDSDAAKAITGWYTYTGMTSVPNHAVLPNAGKIIVLKTADQKFVKVEIISYYKGNPSTTTDTFADLTTRPASRFYTFRFIYQSDGTTNLVTSK